MCTPLTFLILLIFAFYILSHIKFCHVFKKKRYNQQEPVCVHLFVRNLYYYKNINNCMDENVININIIIIQEKKREVLTFFKNKTAKNKMSLCLVVQENLLICFRKKNKLNKKSTPFSLRFIIEIIQIYTSTIFHAVIIVSIIIIIIIIIFVLVSFVIIITLIAT